MEPLLVMYGVDEGEINGIESVIASAGEAIRGARNGGNPVICGVPKDADVLSVNLQSTKHRGPSLIYQPSDDCEIIAALGLPLDVITGAHDMRSPRGLPPAPGGPVSPCGPTGP